MVRFWLWCVHPDLFFRFKRDADITKRNVTRVFLPCMFWSSYSDLPRPGRPKCSFLEGKSPGNQRLVKYYDLARCFLFLGTDSRRLFSREGFFQDLGWGIQPIYHGIPTAPYPQEKLNMAIFQPATLVYRSVHHHVVWRILVFVRPCLPDTRRNQNEEYICPGS